MPNMTGRPEHGTMETNGGSSGSTPCLACTPCVPLFCTSFNKCGNRRAFRLPGEGGDHLHCIVEPSPGYIGCREERTEDTAKPDVFEDECTENTSKLRILEDECTENIAETKDAKR